MFLLAFIASTFEINKVLLVGLGACAIEWQFLYFIFIFYKFILFIYFWLHCLFVAARGLSLVAVSGGYSSLW